MGGKTQSEPNLEERMFILGAFGWTPAPEEPFEQEFYQMGQMFTKVRDFFTPANVVTLSGKIKEFETYINLPLPPHENMCRLVYERDVVGEEKRTQDMFVRYSEICSKVKKKCPSLAKVIANKPTIGGIYSSFQTEFTQGHQIWQSYLDQSTTRPNHQEQSLNLQLR